jgi:hypothetical protein
MRGAFSAHGLRSGYLTEAANRGIPLPEAIEQSRRRSVQQASSYYNNATRRTGRAVRLIGYSGDCQEASPFADFTAQTELRPAPIWIEASTTFRRPGKRSFNSARRSALIFEKLSLCLLT